MIALLRFQAVVVGRHSRTPAVWVPLLLIVSGLSFLSWIGGAEAGGVLSMVFLMPLVGSAMVRTLEALDPLRRSAPVRDFEILGAFFLFWLPICGLIGGLGVLPQWDDRGGTPVNSWFTILLVYSGLCGYAAVYHQFAKRWTPFRAVVAALLLPGVSEVLWSNAAHLSLLAPNATFAECVVPPSLITLAAGAWSLLREEGAWGAVPGMAVAVDTRPEGAGPLPVAAKSPAWTLRRASLFGSGVLLSVPVALAIQFLPTGAEWISALWCVLGSYPMVSGALATARWVRGTPMDTRRAFRILLTPACLFSLLCLAIRPVLVERDPHRLIPFGEYTETTPSVTSMGLDGIGAIYDSTRTRLPSVDGTARKVEQFVRERYGLTHLRPRIDAAILDGWPRDGAALDGAGRLDTMRAVVARIHRDLDPDLRRNLRLRGVLYGLLSCLGFALLLRAGCFGERTYRALMVWLTIPAVGLIVLIPFRWMATMQAMDGAYAAFGDSPVPWTLALLVVIALTLRSSERAFGRMEVVDFPMAGGGALAVGSGG